jgi:hypothetical protein
MGVAYLRGYLILWVLLSKQPNNGLSMLKLRVAVPAVILAFSTSTALDPWQVAGKRSKNPMMAEVLEGLREEG